VLGMMVTADMNTILKASAQGGRLRVGGRMIVTVARGREEGATGIVTISMT